MITAELIRRANDAGITLTLIGGQIVAHGTGTPDPDLVDELRQHRPELHAHLTGQHPPTHESDTITDPDGNTWNLRCRCGLHPSRSHAARPITTD